MSICYKNYAALITSAAFVYMAASFSAKTFAQAPIIDASVNAAGSVETAVSAPPTTGIEQGELFYQLQLLQQEVMQLRGKAEEQEYLLKQLKEQNRERYIELDRRLGELYSSPPERTVNNAAGSSVNNRPVVQVATMPGEKEAYDKAYSLVTSRRFDESLEAFKQFLIDFPAGKYAPNSYYWMGELHQVVQPQNLEGARQAFTVLLDQYPDHAKAPDAIYKLGKVYFLKGNTQKSKQLLDKVIANYSRGSNSTAADKARQFINANF